MVGKTNHRPSFMQWTNFVENGLKDRKQKLKVCNNNKATKVVSKIDKISPFHNLAMSVQELQQMKNKY